MPSYKSCGHSTRLVSVSRFVWAAGIAIVLSGAAASATVSIPTSFREVVADATLVVRGHVTDVRSVAVPGVGIESIATIGIDAVLKGQAGDGFVSFRVPGGEIGRDRFVVVGAPKVTVAEQAVFFLKRGPDNAWRPIGLTMGIYQMKADPATGLAVIDAPVVLGQTASAGQIVRGDARRKPMAVQDFESLVRLIVASQASSEGVRR